MGSAGYPQKAQGRVALGGQCPVPFMDNPLRKLGEIIGSASRAFLEKMKVSDHLKTQEKKRDATKDYPQQNRKIQVLCVWRHHAC